VGSHIGETEKKTEELLEQTHGGVLFVDEAYRLNVKDSDKDFGKEAINTLMKAMTVKGKVIVLAGYPREMAEFVAAVAGSAAPVSSRSPEPDVGRVSRPSIRTARPSTGGGSSLTMKSGSPVKSGTPVKSGSPASFR